MHLDPMSASALCLEEVRPTKPTLEFMRGSKFPSKHKCMLCTHVTQTRESAEDYVAMRSISTEEPNEEMEN